MGISILLVSIQNFIHRKLEEKEEAINKLHMDGDQLLAQNHPGKNAIEVSIRDGLQLPGLPRCSGGLTQPFSSVGPDASTTLDFTSRDAKWEKVFFTCKCVNTIGGAEINLSSSSHLPRSCAITLCLPTKDKLWWQVPPLMGRWT